jgi:endonuclease/exonuclease/phosphatase family metal-dependent hydrolase
MKLLTWNIQWGRGIDLAVDLARIAREACAIADFDVFCLQEVAVNFRGLPGSRGENQVDELTRALPGYTAHFGAATDVGGVGGARSLFGNLILSRLPVLQVYRHLLPWPADPGVTSMQRLALECVLQAPSGPLRVMTTHLEYYSKKQRMAQVEALRQLHREACGHAAAPRAGAAPGDPFAVLPRPASAILTGDFNSRPDSAEYRRIVEAADDRQDHASVRFADAWKLVRPDTPHPPTAGVHEDSWAKPPYCCDFIFVTADLAPRVRDVRIDSRTRASDHQPVLLVLED